MNQSKKSPFSGAVDIMKFTFRHTVRTKGFITSTVLVVLLIGIGMALLSIIPAIMQKNEVAAVHPVHVYVTGDGTIDMRFCSSSVLQMYEHITFEDSSLTVDELTAQIIESGAVTSGIIHSSLSEEEGQLTFFLPEGSEISEDTAMSILDLIAAAVKQNKAALSGLPPAVVSALNMSVFTDVYSAGEESRSIGEILVDMLAPMILSLMVYMIILLYGQTISKSIISEKSSKLMETLLTSVRPYAIIAGKVGALWLASLMQFALWILSGIGGYLIGITAAKGMVPDYVSIPDELIKLIREHTSPDAFSPPAVLLGIFTMLLGVFFYFVFAALASSKIQRAEELSNGMVVFQMPVIAAFMLTYFLPLIGKSSPIATLFPYIPFTAAFSTPSSVIIGNTSLLTAVLSLLITIASTIAVIWLTGRNYKNNLFNQGKKSKTRFR